MFGERPIDAQMMHLNAYEDGRDPDGFDISVQRMSVYVQRNLGPPGRVSPDQDVKNCLLDPAACASIPASKIPVHTVQSLALTRPLRAAFVSVSWNQRSANVNNCLTGWKSCYLLVLLDRSTVHRVLSRSCMRPTQYEAPRLSSQRLTNHA